MASLTVRAKAKVAQVRARRPFVDHVFRALAHYSEVNGNAQAGAITFFGFLSFFPILALSFFVIGYVSKVYPEAQDHLMTVLDKVLPGVVGNGKDEIPMSAFEDYAGAVGIVGLLGLLYSGLGWLTAMRAALEMMFRLPKKAQPGFVVGKLRDLMVLALIGLVLLVSISLTAALSWFSRMILEGLSLGDSWLASVVLWVVAHGLAIAATTVLFVTMFKLLSQPAVSRRALVDGAIVGAVGFEVLKSVAGFLIALTKDQPAFQAFGVALILLLWISYFSRLVMLAAAWAYKSPVADKFPEPHPGSTPHATSRPEVARDPVVDTGSSTSPLTSPAPSPMHALAPELETMPLGGAAASSAHGAVISSDGHMSDGHKRALTAAGTAAGLAALGALALKRHRSSS